MLKVLRKAVSLLVVMVLMTLVLAACGTDTAPATGTTPALSATTVAAPTSSTTATTPATAMSQTTTAATASPMMTTTATVMSQTTTVAAPTATATPLIAVTVADTRTPAASTGSAIACTSPIAAATSGKKFKIGIAVQNTIPALVNAINGVKEGLKQCGFIEGQNVTYKLGNALGDIPALSTIGRTFADDKVDLIVAVGTAALTNMYTTNKDNGTPIVFNSVTDPYKALPDVIKSATDHSFVTGVQAFPPVEDGLKITLQAVPNAKNIGFIYNPAEANAVATLKEAQDVAKKLNLTIVTAIVQNSGEVLTAAQSIADKVDVFFSTTDVTVVNALESVVKVATDNKKPLIALDPASGPRGAAIAIGLDYVDNGIASAKLAAQILDGKKAETIAIERQPKGPTVVNLKAAEVMGLKIPDAILSQATEKYTDITPPKK